jgi:cell division protein FtsI/penicillin-binding protein 2
MARVKDREDHETLVGSLEKRLGVVVYMFRLYAGTPEMPAFLTDNGFDGVMQYSFTNETVSDIPKPAA